MFQRLDSLVRVLWAVVPGLFLSVFLAQVAVAQSGPPGPLLKGRVATAKGELVAYAAVTLAGTSSGAVANAEGSYRLILPQRGSVNLLVRSLGYKTVARTVDVQSDTMTVNFTLEEEDLILPDQIITANGEDPAYGIMRSAIKRKRFNDNAVKAYSVKAYTKIIGIDREAQRKRAKAAKTGSKSDKRKADDATDGVGGIAFLSESYSTKYVQKPNKEKEIVHQSRVSGNASNYSALASLGVVLNPYDNLLDFPREIFPREFVCPVADNAFFFYRFKLLGTLRERGHTIYKIEVIPKRPADPVVAGLIYIVEGSYAVKGLDWSVNKKQPMRYFDTLYFRQDYLPLRDSIWMPFQNYIGARLAMDLLLDKVDISGSLLNVFSDYNITDPPMGGSARAPRTAAAQLPTVAQQRQADVQRRARDEAKRKAEAEKRQKQQAAERAKADADADALAAKLGQQRNVTLSDSTEAELARMRTQREQEQAALTRLEPAAMGKDEKKFWDEIIKVEPNVTAKNRNAAFWDSLRPTALSQDESREFQRGDSIQFGRDSTKILDSLYKRRHRFTTFPSLGWRYSNPRTRTSYGLSFNLLDGWNYNTVEGFNLVLNGDYRWRIAERKFVSLNGALRYAIGSERISYRIGGSVPLNRQVQEALFFEGGYYPTQFSSFEQIREQVNTYYSLLAEQNFMKIYQRAGGRVQYQRRLTKDNILAVVGEYWRREPLRNLRSLQAWTPIDDREYTPNQPPPPGGVAMRDHEAASLTLRYLLRVSSKYITTPDGTFYINDPGWPRFSFEYTLGNQRAVDFNTTFHRTTLRIDGSIDAKLLGETNYRFRGAKMWRNGPLEIPDALHVRGNETIFRVDELDRFGILNYYRYFSNDRMVETHVEHNFRGFWLNKLPLIRTLKWHEIIGVHHVAMPGLSPHTELLVGISNIRVLRLDLFRINYHLALTGENTLRSGFTFTIGLQL